MRGSEGSIGEYIRYTEGALFLRGYGGAPSQIFGRKGGASDIYSECQPIVAVDPSRFANQTQTQSFKISGGGYIVDSVIDRFSVTIARAAMRLA